MTLLLLLKTDAAPVGDQARVTRVGVEVLGTPDTIKSRVTRVGVEVLGVWDGLELRVTRIGVEAASLEYAITEFNPSALPAVLPEVFIANWIDVVQVTSNWQSSLSKARSTQEERWSLTDRPVRTVSVRLSGLSKKQAVRIGQQMHRLVSEETFFPLYSDQSKVTDVTGAVVTGDFQYKRFFDNQRISLVKVGTRGDIDSVEFGQVLSVTNTTMNLKAVPSSTDYNRIYPLFESNELRTVGLTTQNRDTVDVLVTAVEKEGWGTLPSIADSSGFATYFDWFVFPFRANRTSPVQTNVVRDSESFVLGRGSHVELRGDKAYSVVRWGFNFFSRSKWWDFARFFELHRGRNVPFFAAVDRNEFEDPVATTSHVDVTARGIFTDFVDSVEYIALGTAIIKVGSIVDNGSTWRIVFAKPLTAVDSSVRVTRAAKFRFVETSYEESWSSDSIVSVSVVVVELRKDRPVDVENL